MNCEKGNSYFLKKQCNADLSYSPAVKCPLYCGSKSEKTRKQERLICVALIFS